MKTFEDIRMVCHQLVEPDFENPEELVAWMGAIQAQDYTMAKWAIGVRLKSAVLQQVDEAMAAGKIVRTHIMRPTWHFVAGKDLRGLRLLTGERVKKVIDGWIKSSGLDISEETYTKCNDLIGKMLSGNHSLTKEEIEAGLEKAGVCIRDERVRRYLLRAEMEGVVCSGADKNGKPTYALLDEQLAHMPEVTADEALARLAVCYFRSHSPATVRDFVWWSGLTGREVRKAIDLISGCLVKEVFDEQEFWIYPPVLKEKTRHVLHFLPPYDEYLISYKERKWIIPEEHHPKAFNRWGTFYPVVMYQGHIIGNWSKKTKKENTVLSTSFFNPDVRIPGHLLKEAEQRFRTFYVKGNACNFND